VCVERRFSQAGRLTGFPNAVADILKIAFDELHWLSSVVLEPRPSKSIQNPAAISAYAATVAG
jgi:hypothetical protein